MLIVKLLRWIFGYFDFEIKGRFPERFLNLAVRNGLNLWNMKGEKEELHATAKIADKNTAELFAQKTESELIIEKEHGLPYLCRTYKSRLGLLVGLIMGVALSCWLSGFIWNIEVNVPPELNEYEIRNQLRELGFYKGVRYNSDSIDNIKRKMKLNDERISWVSINIFGTNAVVELSPKISVEKDKEINKKAVSNLKSTADGTITKINVHNGTAVVEIGEGVRKGQLLVSGIMEYNNGTNVMADSEGTVYAKTSRTVTLSVPKEYNKAITSDEYVCKREFSFFGISFPITLCGNPVGEYYKKESKLKPTLFDNALPISITEEKWQRYETKKLTLGSDDAKKLLDNRLKLYEMFLIYSDDRTIISKNSKFQEKNSIYYLTVSYEVEENICEKSYIQVKE